jgi:hypothetical protein
MKLLSKIKIFYFRNKKIVDLIIALLWIFLIVVVVVKDLKAKTNYGNNRAENI